MKYIVGLLFLLALSFGNSSCQKEFVLGAIDSSLITLPGLPGGVKGNFTANIDGVKFNADKGASATRSLGIIGIAGLNIAGETITIRVADSGVHVYSLNIASLTNAAAYAKGTEYAYTTNAGNGPQQSGGSLSITSIDTDKKTISGKFSMNVFRQYDNTQKKITEGVFTNIPYETDPVQPGNASDTFRVKIDGTPFPVYSVVSLNLYNLITIVVNDQAAGKTVGLTMPSNIKPGTYDYSPFGMEYMAQYNPSSTIYLTASSGKLTILEHNITTKRIKGNFNFGAQELIGSAKANLTEGYFSVTYK